MVLHPREESDRLTAVQHENTNLRIVEDYVEKELLESSDRI